MTAFEQALVDEVIAEIRRRDGYLFNAQGNATHIGIPDVLACVYGRFVAIEAKQRGKRARRRQRVELARIRRAGGVAFEADSIETVRKAFDALKAA